MERLTVEAIEDARGLRAFIRFPEILYRDDPCLVPPLRRDERARLSASNPFFAHADARFFLARWDREVVGRVAAIVDRWHLERRKDGAGFLGFFEAIADDSVAGSLIEAVCGWLRAQGLAVLRGPFNPSTNDVCGLLTDGFQYLPRIMMPYNLPDYPTLLERAGLRPVRELLSYELDVPPALPEAVSRVANAASGRGVRVRSLDPRRLSAEAEAFRGIYNAAWSENWGFVPMSESEAAWMASHLRPVLVADFGPLCRMGRPARGSLSGPTRSQSGPAPSEGPSDSIGAPALPSEASGGRRAAGDTPRGTASVPAPGDRSPPLPRGLRSGTAPGYRRAELGWIDEENAVTRRAAAAVGRQGGQAVPHV
jgi:hypothetical protein